MHIPLAIDPLALLLRSDIYIRLTLPDPAPDLAVTVAAFLKTASPEAKAAFIQHTGAYVKYFTAVEKAIHAVQ